METTHRKVLTNDGRTIWIHAGEYQRLKEFEESGDFDRMMYPFLFQDRNFNKAQKAAEKDWRKEITNPKPTTMHIVDTNELPDADFQKAMDLMERTGISFMNNPLTAERISADIQNLPAEERGQVSDGYHTFDELYDHRITNYIATCKLFDRLDEVRNPERYFSPVWKSKFHSDGTHWDGWFILGIFTERGQQITYHLPMSRWDECAFAITRMSAPQWDGHTSADVLRRMKHLPI